MKKISLIIPVFNGSKYIDECITSILNNSDLCDRVEIIIINDGSTDNSIDILKKYSQKYDFINVFNNSNHGVSYSRNYGIKMATSEFLMFVDIDDKLSDNWFDLIIEKLNSKNDIIYFSNVKVDGKKDLINLLVGFNNDNICIAQPFSKIFRREFLLKNNIFFNENLINGEDMIFNIEAILKTDNYIVVDDHFYYYRQVFGSATKRFDEMIFENEKNFQINLKKISKSIDLYDVIKFSKTNGLFVLIDRVCYLESFSQVRYYFMQITNDICVDDIDIYIDSFYKRVILKLFFNRFYFITYLFCRFKNIFIKVKLKDKKDKFKLM